MPETETQEKRKVEYLYVEEAPVKMPQYGDTLPAVVKKLGMTTAKEQFGDEARNPDQKVLVIFAESEDGQKANTPLTWYDHPSAKSKLARFTREYGQPKTGMHTTIIRNEKGFWEIKL